MNALEQRLWNPEKRPPRSPRWIHGQSGRWQCAHRATDRRREGLADADGHALAGFLDAEGCFQIRPNNRGRTWHCHMTVAVRDDDAQLLTDLCRVTGLGRVAAKPAHGTSRPQVRWTIASKRECAELARTLRAFPLRARKRRDFEIWARCGRSLGHRPVRRPGQRLLPCRDGR